MSLQDMFVEAHRRVCIAKNRGETSRDKIWTGLEYPSYMKPMVDRGWMRPVDGETPKVLNWYTFTEAGWAKYDQALGHAPDYFDDEAFKNFSLPANVFSSRAPEVATEEPDAPKLR